MNTKDAMAMGEANRSKEMMVFDWDKAARLIVEKKPHRAWAGLRGDFCNTGGMIYEDGKLKCPSAHRDSYAFSALS